MTRSRLMQLVAAMAGAGVLAAAGTAGAQDLTIKAPPQARAVAIVSATVHTVSGETIENGYVLFDRGRITAVGRDRPRNLDGAEVVDGAGKHVYPGLIASCTQVGLQEFASVRATRDFSEVGAITPEVWAAVAVNPDSTLIPVTRANGVLAAALFPEGGRIPGRISVMKMEGWTWEEMAVKADAGLAVQWPQVRALRAWWMDRDEGEQEESNRRQFAEVDDAFKAAAAYHAARQADPTLPNDLRWEAMRGVLPRPAAGSAAGGADAGEQRPVFISAQDLDQIVSAVMWAVDRGLRPVIVGGRDAVLCADLLKRHDVPVILRGTHTFPKRADSPYDDAFTLPARLHAAGIRIAIASADRTAHERNLPYNAATAVAYGLDREAAIKSVTLWAAEILGVADTLGSIDVGKSATLILTDGDPLEITTQVERAWIDGRAIDLSNKHTKLAEKYREKYRQQRSAGQGDGAGSRDGTR